MARMLKGELANPPAARGACRKKDVCEGVSALLPTLLLLNQHVQWITPVPSSTEI